MKRRVPARKTIASYVSPGGFAPQTRAALEGLGYRVVAVSTRGRFSDDSWEPDVRIVDERYLGRLPEEGYLPRVPIIQLSGEPPRGTTDPRVLGSVPRPADLSDLYPLLQAALEQYPRRAPRAPTQIPARCTREEQRWIGSVTSLSEGGCLFRSRNGLPEGMHMNVLFPLPMGRMIATRARVLREERDGVGLAFENPGTPARRAIREFVKGRLASLP